MTSEIVSFYKNQKIFITGGTGFLGKLMIEKLLRDCWDVDTIYILMRPKRDKTVDERLLELFDQPCFDKIKHKNIKEKICMVPGDCTKPSLGLSAQDLTLLKNEITCIFHLAANVKFDQTFHEVSAFVRSTKEMLKFASEASKLKAFLFVSTAYTNHIEPIIEEKIYDPPMKADTLFDLVDKFKDEELQHYNHWCGKSKQWPNRYSFGKSITEHLIQTTKLNIPVTIVRPAIITNTIEEPIKGWIDNFYGPIGITCGAYMGIVKSLPAIGDYNQNLAPADYVSNFTLAAMWKTAIIKSENVTVYNYVGKPISYAETVSIFESFYWDYPSVNYIWYKRFKINGNKFWHNFHCSDYFILAYIIDFIFLLLQKPSNVVKKYSILKKGSDLLADFTTRKWTFDDTNVYKLWDEMSKTDQEIFNFDSRKIIWNRYLRDCAIGIRLYLIKDPIETIPQGKKKLWTLFVAHYTIVFLFVIFISYLIKMLFAL